MSGNTKRDEVPAARAAEGSIEVAASPERVWRALTDADELERWFPLDAAVEPPGSGGRIWMSWGADQGAWAEIEEWDVTDDPEDGLLRLTIDPAHGDPDARDVSVWLCAWGGAGDRVDAAAGRWKSELARLFPDGTPIEAGA